MYKRSLNIPKILVLQGTCIWTTKVPSFICCDCACGAISLSQSSQLSPQPASAIDYLGHCQRHIRTRLTVCWLMLNQEKAHRTLRGRSQLKRISSPSLQRVFLPLSHTSLTRGLHQLPQLPWKQQLSPCKESFLHGQPARELLPFVSDVILPTITHFLKVRLWHHIPHRKVSWLSSTVQDNAEHNFYINFKMKVESFIPNNLNNVYLRVSSGLLPL